MAALDLPFHGTSDEKHGTPPILLEPDDKPNSTVDHISEGDDDTMKELQVPIHPIPSMQGAFAESMLEASAASAASAPTILRAKGSDAAARRRKLLDQDPEEETHAAKWGQKPGQRHHELWKLMAQIAFGIYLLLDGIAKDDEQVLNILHGHVDDVDAFLESTLEDFDLAARDIQERLKFLQMPLENIDIFDAMLEDRQFRFQIVTGNERIEHIIQRTASAMNDALKDVQQGLEATKAFALYLAEEQEEGDWKRGRPEMQKVYDAMKGNTEGWYRAYMTLQTKGNRLGESLVQLGSIVAEMNKRAGEISRKTRFSVIPGTSPALPTTARSTSPSMAASHFSQPSLISVASSVAKNLPTDPAVITPAIRSTLPAFQYASERERVPGSQVKESEALKSKSKVEQAEKELVFTLQPRTYSSVPHPPTPVQHPAPRVASPSPKAPPVSPARKRFSLRRKAAPERKPTLAPPTSSPSQSQPNLSLQTISEAHPTDYPNNERVAAHNHTPSDHSRSMAPIPQPHQNYNNDPVASPRSDQQHFRPVRASTHSPLQRPWTSTPTNLRSATSISTISQMTTITEDGKKVRKRGSGFGWLKKAFSLSEEEKAIFEAKRRSQPPKDYAADTRPQFLDGRRIR